ncbi:MAG: AtpZ/AtpI family protein [Candidatus Limnocylindrales bacterium]
MADPTAPRRPTPQQEQEAFARRASRKAERHRAASARPANVLLWMRAIGIVGWSIVVPTLIGLFVGRWLDEAAPSGSISWTLTLLLLGLVVGIAVAGGWVRREGLGR